MNSWPRSGSLDLPAIHLPLGRLDYSTADRLQKRLHGLRCQGSIPDTIITVEHNAVFTIGRSGSKANLIASPYLMQKEGIGVYSVDRGGDITYHGPGQLVMYPIVDLRRHGSDLHAYVNRLEQGTIDYLAEEGVTARRRPGYPGVWVNSRKIASLGVYVKRWVTRHGLALNIKTNKKHFSMIRPCGMDIETVCLDELIDHTPSLSVAAEGLVDQMKRLFGWQIEKADPESFLKE